MTRLLSVSGAAALSAVLVAAPAHAAFPGANGLIAYSTGPDSASRPAQIYTMTADGKERKRLTTEGSAQNPAWSRDSKRIAFDRAPTRNGRRALYVMNDDGSAVTRVRAGGRQAYNPAWSPDGRRLVFEGCREKGPTCETPSIFVVRVGGGGLQRIAPYGRDPVWSPTGKWIAYAGKVAKGDACGTLIRVKPSGRHRRALQPREPDAHERCSWGGTGADFSPDGRRLVYEGLHATGYNEYPNPAGGTIKVWNYDAAMYTIGVDGKGRKLVTTRSLRSFHFFLNPFVWSPDGKRLLWRDDRGIYLSKPDGSNVRRIQSSGGEPSWQALGGS